MAQDTSLVQAYQAFRSSSLCQNLSIPPAIWVKLSKEIQAEIQAIRVQLRDNPGTPAQTTPPSTPPPKLPQQYGLPRHINNTAHDDDLAQINMAIQSFQLHDEDEITTLSDDDTRMGGMVSTISYPLQVQAHVEYAHRFAGLSQTRVSHAICDSGADSCVVGKMAKVLSVTMRSAHLVGYDPNTTRSGCLPIVTALLRTMSADQIPILL